MSTVTIGNSYSKITGLNAKEFQGLRKLLSYEDDPSAAYFSRGYSRRHYLLDRHGNFPSGLLDRVMRHFPVDRTRYCDIRERPKISPETLAGDFKCILRSDQHAAANMAVMSHRGIISMPTGSGKSVVIALIASLLGLKTLIIVPTLELRYQLDNYLDGVFGIDYKCVVRNIGASDLPKLTDFDCLIIDEAHHVAARTYQKLNKTAWKNIYYRFFLTATPFRNRSHEQLLFEGIAGQVIYQLSYKDAVSKGYIVPVEAYYIDLPTKKQHYGDTWVQVYSSLVVNYKDRNQLIRDLLKTLGKDKSILCLVKEIAHGRHIAGEDFEFANGQDHESSRAISLFNAGTHKVLVGTQAILGEGVDTKPAEYVIIAGLGKAKSSFMQAVGRGVRTYEGKESAKIILFKDNSHKWTREHFKAQAKILEEEYGVTPQKLEL